MDSKERGAEADKATFIEEVGRNGRREFAGQRLGCLSGSYELRTNGKTS